MAPKVRKGSLGRAVVVSSARKNKDKFVKQVGFTLDSTATAGEWSVFNAQINDDFRVNSTIKGIRWNMSFNTPSAATMYLRWAICVFKAGEQLPNFNWDDPTGDSEFTGPGQTLASTPLAPLLQPDEKVIVHDCAVLKPLTQSIQMEGATKGMRKVNPGDKFILVVAIAPSTAAAGQVHALGDLQYVLLT